jgi:hypothetical protein
MTAQQRLAELENQINATAISALERAQEQAAQAATRLTERIVKALDDYPEEVAEAKWGAVLRKDTQLTVNPSAGTMTLHVSGEPLFTCPAQDLYGPDWAEVLATLAEAALPEHDHDPQPA